MSNPTNRPNYWMYGLGELPVFVQVGNTYHRVIDWEESELPTDWFVEIPNEHKGTTAVVMYSDGTAVNITLPEHPSRVPLRVEKV